MHNVKKSNIANVFVLNRQKQSFNGYSPIGPSKRNIDYVVWNSLFHPVINIFSINFTEENSVNDKQHYNKTCSSIAYIVQAGYQYRANAFLLD